MGTSIAVALLSMVYRFLCIRENRKRDATGTLEGFDHAYEDDLTDKKVSVLLPACTTSILFAYSSSGSHLTSLANRIRNFATFCRYGDSGGKTGWSDLSRVRGGREGE